RDAGGDVAAVDREGDGGALDRLTEREGRGRGDVRPGPRAGTAAELLRSPAAEHRAEDVLEAARALAAGRVADPGPARAAAAEHAAEHVLEACAPGAAGPRGEAGTAAGHRPDRVVLLALLGVRQHGVRLADLLELRLGARVT